MLRRPTRSPQTLRYAKRKPRRSGAFVVNRRTSLVAQTAGHASVAKVAYEAVARARLIPVDVRFVMAKVVADYGVVHGLRRSAAVRVRRDYDPARDTGGARGDVAREMVAPDLHTLCAEKPYAYPGESIRWALPGVVRNLVCYHLVVADGVRIASEKGQARTVVMNLISDEGTSASVDDDDTVSS